LVSEKALGFFSIAGIIPLAYVMKRPVRIMVCVLYAALLATCCPCRSQAKGYSSGGRSYSSSSSHSSSSGGSKSFHSSGGKSYSSGSNWSDNSRRSYGSARSYSSGPTHTFSSGSGKPNAARPGELARKPGSDGGPHALSFDTAASRASKEQASKADFTRFKQAQTPNAPGGAPRSDAGTPSYSARPPPLPASGSGAYRPSRYVPDSLTIATRPVRIYNVFNPYWSRPVVIYHDPYNSLFWWWLLDRALDDQAWWAYHHRYDMDPARYDALLAHDQQLEARVAQLEAQQVPRDPNYVPPGVDRDLMYSDRYVAQTYHNRPTTLGVVAFWLLGIPTALGVCGAFIWLIWFKRWQTST